jgi:sugar (pentulose or hexulose) kinase
VRAQCFDERAEPVDELRQERYEGRDPDEIVRLVREVIGGREADATGISWYAHSLVALDGCGRPLTEVLDWRDTRSAGAAAWLRRRLDGDAVHARTGGYLHPSFWPAKLAWLARTEPDLYRLDERRVIEGGALSDGGNLRRWLERTLAGGGEAPGDRGPEEHGLAFLPFLGGERSTGWDPDATGAIAGLTFATTPEDIRQAALEGVAFRLAAVADLLPEVEEVVATGGALREDPAWMQVVADALGRPVTASGVAEASLRGAAVAALERLGREAPEAPLGGVFLPREERADAYRSARERHRRLYEELRGEH